MSELLFRTNSPRRTYSGKGYSDYKRYKNHLSGDFDSRCGYTFCRDFWFGGQINFQIDHFKPKSKYPDLATNYGNLVYSCSYVNRAKSDDYNEYYLDPVETDYNEHFFRDELGNIYPKKDSEAAKYMYVRLKLYLKRNSIIWLLEQLEEKMEQLRELIEETDSEESRQLFIAITMKYMDYKKYLGATQ